MRGEDVKDVRKFPGQHLSKDSPSRCNCTLSMGREHRGGDNPKAFDKFFIWSGTMVPVLGSLSLYHVPEQLQGAP